MKSIKIGDKEFRIGSPFKRLLAFFFDVTHIVCIFIIMGLLFGVVQSGVLWIGLLSALLWILGPKTNLPNKALVVVQLLLVFVLGPWGNADVQALAATGTALGVGGLLLMDGFKNGQGIGKKLLSLQVRRLKDGKPASFTDSLIRRLVGVILPFDFLWCFGKEGRRLGDKLAETVVVDIEPVSESVDEEPEGAREVSIAPEEIVEQEIRKMNSRLSEAREKVDAALGVEKQFQDAYKGAIAQSERWEERAVLSLKAEREDLAREDLEKRNEYRQLAEQYKGQWNEQKQIVDSLNNLLEHFQQKIVEAEGKKAVVMAQSRNIEAETHLRQMLKEMQESEVFGTLGKTEQERLEVATLAKAATEVDMVYQDMKLEREFAGYAEEASLERDLAELKAKLEK